MNKETYKNITGTLDYGKKMSAAMITFWVVTVLMGVGTCVAFTIATVQEHEPLLILAAVLFPVYFLGMSGYVLIREYKHRKIIKLWCEDAVKLTAITAKKYCAEAQNLIVRYGNPNEEQLQRGPFFFQFFSNKYKYYPLFILQVVVSYKGENHVFYSLKRQKSQFDTFFLRGYSYHSEVVEKYGDGKIDVLYSPRYNKVMFLKNERVRPNFSPVGEYIEEDFDDTLEN